MALAAYFTDPPRRNVLLLASCQALASSGNTILIAVAALVGQILADDKSLATLPIAFQWTATMCMTIPAAQLMRRYGRRAGLSLGAVIYAAGGALGFVAILSASFSLFALSCILTGFAQSFIQYYRFAAADTAPEDFKSKAISLVLAGGVVAAIVGGELAKVSTELFMGYLYAGCYAVVVVLGLVALATLQGLRIPGLTAEQRASSGRPLHVIARQPVFLVAVLAAAIAYASMILVMTATPLAMTGHGFAFNQTATVIQWHILAMYAPSFFTGHLIQRFGVTCIIALGGGLLAISLTTNIVGIDFFNFWTGLVALGLGWNFMFVGATALLTEAYTIEERAKTQAANEFIVFSTTAIAAFGSGALYSEIGWIAVNGAALPAMGIVLAGLAWLAIRRRADTSA